MKDSVAIETIGKGLSYEKSTAGQVKSAGGELLRRAKSIEETEKTVEAYQNLIMAVATKTDGETRHETALRYIQQAEAHCNDPAQA